MSTAASPSSAPLFPPLSLTPTQAKLVRSWRSRELPSPPLSRFAHPYYILHVLLFLLYFPTRQFLLPFVNPDVKRAQWSNTDEREVQMFFILLLMLFTKYRRCSTLDSFAAMTLRYSKLCVLFASLVVDYRLLTWFACIYGGVTLAGPSAPGYSGPTLVREVSAPWFLTNVDNAEADPDISFVVELYSADAEECKWMESELARVSLHYGYGGSSVQFIRLSLDSFPALVDRFQILTPAQNRLAHELPTLLMFQGGRLLARLPEAGRKTMMNEANIVRAMDLENRARVDPLVLRELEEKKGTKIKPKSK